MRSLRSFFASTDQIRRDQLSRLIGMAGLYFLIMCSLGILKPVRNAFALAGLAHAQFYRVYLVSAAVILFVPLYTRLADRVPLRKLIPRIALFFAISLLLFRAAYVEGSAAYGLIFYGWYDLLAAALVTQFFLATQVFFNSREARRVYPTIIAGGALGATLGGATTGFLAETIQTPNLLVVAAGFLLIIAVALPLTWAPAQESSPAVTAAAQPEQLTTGEFREMLADPHVRLIAGAVLLSVLVEQLVDYQFNTITEEVFQTRDAISAFQGKFHAATQWLPLLALAFLRPLLQRWGVGLVIFLLPFAMLLTNLGLAASWTLVAAVLAKASDTGLRYTAERTGREILYVPLAENIKLKAKVYIDVAVERGIGKPLSGVLIFLLLGVIPYNRVGYVAAGLSLLWILLATGVRREYVRTLARSIQGRVASLQGVFVSLADANTLPVVRNAVASGDTLQIAFVLDLLEKEDPAAIRPLADDLHRLLDHPSPDIRERALVALASCPDAVDPARVREKLSDPSRAVREAATRTLCMADPAHAELILKELLESDQAAVRTAALTCLNEGLVSPDVAQRIAGWYLDSRLGAAGADLDARVDAALAVGTMKAGSPAASVLEPLLDDPHPQVAVAALRSAGTLGGAEYYPKLIAALGRSATREAARDALVRQGTAVVDPLAEVLLDPRGDPAVRRTIPAVLAGIPDRATVSALLRTLEAPETDELLDYRILKALGKLRSRHSDLFFDEEAVLAGVERETAAALLYLQCRSVLTPFEESRPGVRLLRQALWEAWGDRRERIFRWLGLIYPSREVHRCYLALGSGSATSQANAMEWLEQTVGYSLFAKLSPLLRAPSRGTGAPVEACGLLRTIALGGDPWLAEGAAHVAEQLCRGRNGGGLAAYSARSAAALATSDLAFTAQAAATETREETDVNLIEKVFLLQQIDLLQGARSAHLALLASIAQEVEVKRDAVLLRQGEPTDALYVVIRGAVELRGVGEQVLVAQNGTAFGTWALIDEAPSLVSARAAEDSRLLRITREDFYDLLADHHELALGLLQGLARRVRTLVT